MIASYITFSRDWDNIGGRSIFYSKSADAALRSLIVFSVCRISLYTGKRGVDGCGRCVRTLYTLKRTTLGLYRIKPVYFQAAIYIDFLKALLRKLLKIFRNSIFIKVMLLFYTAFITASKY